MRKYLINKHAVIIVFLTVACFDSREKDDIRDSGFADSQNTNADDARDSGFADSQNTNADDARDSGFADSQNAEVDAEVLNECQRAKGIRLDAIRDMCSEAQLAGCCYCECELLDDPSTGCDCSSWSLTRDLPETPCEPAFRGAAIECLNNEMTCRDVTKSMVSVYCR